MFVDRNHFSFLLVLYQLINWGTNCQSSFILYSYHLSKKVRHLIWKLISSHHPSDLNSETPSTARNILFSGVWGGHFDFSRIHSPLLCICRSSTHAYNVHKRTCTCQGFFYDLRYLAFAAICLYSKFKRRRRNTLALCLRKKGAKIAAAGLPPYKIRNLRL